MRMFRFWLRNDFFYKFSDVAKKEKEALKVLHGFTDQVIRERRAELLKNGTNNGVVKVKEKRKLTFLDILLQSTIEGQSLSNLDIREEVDTFMFEVNILF